MFVDPKTLNFNDVSIECSSDEEKYVAIVFLKNLLNLDITSAMMDTWEGGLDSKGYRFVYIRDNSDIVGSCVKKAKNYKFSELNKFLLDFLKPQEKSLQLNDSMSLVFHTANVEVRLNGKNQLLLTKEHVKELIKTSRNNMKKLDLNEVSIEIKDGEEGSTTLELLSKISGLTKCKTMKDLCDRNQIEQYKFVRMNQNVYGSYCRANKNYKFDQIHILLKDINEPSARTFKINNDYTAKFEGDTVHVGCQSFSKSKLDEVEKLLSE